MKMEKMEIPGAQEEKILVLVRLRPLSDKEISAYEVADWECINETTILYRNSLREGSTFPSTYTFDRVFRGDCSTRQVYDDGVKEIALSTVSGINSSIFAYGQTCSGKTYTMIGITEYTVSDIFDYIHRHEERAFVLKFSAIEIYNESVRDLLSTDNTPLKLLDDPEKGTIVEKATEETLRDWNHLKELLLVCEAQRRIGETSLNEKSSRSHQILRLTIESSAREFLGKENSTTLSASVNFIDLAGSERASRALSASARLKEGCHINRSLLTLGTVIRKLSKGKHGHINYRDSKLTRLLQPALGGNARTAIICTLNPGRGHVEQTRNTLLFACCAKEVTTKAQVNVVMSDKALVKHLQRELARLECELKSPAPASSSCDYTLLLQKKDLQIQKMEKEIRELMKQRELAESRVEDLLKMIGNGQNSRKLDEINHLPNQQVGDAWEDECSISASPGVVDSHPMNGGLRNFKTVQYDDGQSRSNLDEPFYHLQNSEDHALSDGTLSLMSFRENLVRSNSCQSLEDTAEDPNDYYEEVKCIELEESSRQKNCESLTLSNTENEGTSTLEDYGDGEATEEMTSTQVNGNRVNGMPNGFAYSALEQKLCHVQNTVYSFGSPYHDELPSSRSWSCGADLMSDPSSPCTEKAEQIVSTPPDGLERSFTGRPDRLRWKIPPSNYDPNISTMSRNDSQSSLGSASSEQSTKTSAGEDVTTIRTFVEGLNMAKHQYEEQLTDGQAMGLAATSSEKKMKDVGLEPMQEALETSRGWPSEFMRQQRAILELWQTFNVSLVHRTYFFLLFRGDPSDSIYMEVELRRLSFLKENFSRGNHTVLYDQNLTFGSSMKALRRERGVLSKLMHKRFSEEERKRLYQKWGIGLNSKHRSLQLANSLWSSTQDMNQIMESASIVAKLVRFVEKGQPLKEMFGLSFNPQHSRRRLFGWKNSKASLF